MDNDRLIMLATNSTDQFYVGIIDIDDAELSLRMRQGEAIKLKDARVLQSALIPQMTPQGPQMKLSVNLLPIALHFDGAEMLVRPTAIIWPTGITLSELERMIEGSKRVETNLRAQQSGLIMANAMPGNNNPVI